MNRPFVRIRINADGVQVWNLGKWVPADDAVLANVRRMFDELVAG